MKTRNQPPYRHLGPPQAQATLGSGLPPSGFIGCIQSAASDPDNPDTVYVLDLLNDDTAPGTQVVVQPFVSGKPTQQWCYGYSSDQFFIQFQNMAMAPTACSLGVGDAIGNGVDGYYLVLLANEDQGNCQWIASDSDLLTVVNSVYPNLVVDVDGGIPQPNVPVIAYPMKTPLAANQQWTWANGVTAPPQFVSDMQGTTITEGWDAIVAISAEQVNSIFQNTFALNYFSHQTTSISTSVDIGNGQQAQLVNLILGPPLIQISPANQSQQASLTIPIVGGVCLQLNGESSVDTVFGIQLITSSQNYAITGDVPLSSIQGDVKNQAEVVLDIASGVNFSAQLGLGQLAPTALGKALQKLLAESSGNTYSLGTIFTGSAGNLSPVSFVIGTQVSEDSNDAGRVLLFVTTQEGTPGTTTNLSYTNLVPPGYSAALIVSSTKFFAGLFGNAIETNWEKQSVQDVYATSSDFGFAIMGSPTSENAVSIPQWTTGSCDGGPGNVVLPVSLQWSPNSNSGVNEISGGGSGYWSVAFIPTQGDCQLATLGLVWNYTPTYTLYIESNNIQFGGGGALQLTVASNLNLPANFDAAQAANQVASTFQNVLENLFEFSIPDISTFAVSNLLFPDQSSVNFETVYLPGDLVAFGNMSSGNIQISPSTSALSAAASVTFTAGVASGDTVTWSAEKGVITQDGVYTAPPVINQGSISWVTATSSETGESASAVVALEPNALIVNPIFALTFPDYGSQTFAASGPNSDGGSANWTVSAGGGTIDSGGNYTPPSSVGGLTLATVTATTSSGSGTSSILILPQLPFVGGVTPAFVELKSKGTQAFATVEPFSSGNITWSILPATGGTVDSDGNYTAPSKISTLEVVSVVATSTGSMSAVGVVLLNPDQ
jgi:hypothetical protein